MVHYNGYLAAAVASSKGIKMGTLSSTNMTVLHDLKTAMKGSPTKQEDLAARKGYGKVNLMCEVEQIFMLEN
jgi:hypothetical protein